MARFVVLAYGITWLAVTPLVLGALGIGHGVPAWWHGFGALGPILAAYWSRRDHGLFARRQPSALTPPVIALSLATPALFAAVSLLAVALTGVPVIRPLLEACRNSDWILSLLVGSVLYGLGEEPGWRGWLLPYLQQRHSAVRATLLLTPVWAVWHLPFFIYRFDFAGPGTVAGFFAGLLAGAFWLTFLFNSTGGSVRVVAAWHVLWNVMNVSLAAVSPAAVAILNTLMMILGYGVVVVYGRRGLSVNKGTLEERVS